VWRRFTNRRIQVLDLPSLTITMVNPINASR
jgi:hypothetical protein